MEDSRVNVNVSDEYKGGDINVILREGQAKRLPQQNSYSIEGNISTALTYLINKINGKDTLEISHTIITCDKHKMELGIQYYPHFSDLTVSVLGKVSIDPDLAKLGINKAKKYSPMELSQLLKFYRLFMDHEENLRIVKSLNEFKVQVDKQIEQGNDFKGNKKYIFEQKIKQESELSFVLNIPIVKYEKKSKFKVEIQFDVRDNAIEMWLESIELKEIHDEIINVIIDREVNAIEELGYSVIFV